MDAKITHTIVGPFFGGKIKERFAATPMVITEKMLESIVGQAVFLDEGSVPIGEVTATEFNAFDGWWYLRAVLHSPLPTMTGLAIAVRASKLPAGGLKEIRIYKVCLVEDPWDAYARFTVLAA
jgi:hypothetical protein